jgi:glycosyltransferase involved in cell wall biosynthesis
MMVNGLYRGGVRAVVDNVVSVLVKHHQVSLFVGMEWYGRRLYDIQDWQEGPVTVRGINIYKFRNTRQVRNYCNPEAEFPFKEYLEQVKPDLVHFHSCSCIGASVVRIVRDMGIPFLVTMHDWWWFCPRLYLVDNRFEVCSQSQIVQPELCYCVRPKGFEAKRYNYLRPFVEELPLILVPSRFIRDSLVQNGVDPDRVRINPNGVRIPDVVLDKNPSDYLRFGFLGGSDGFKGGLILLKAAQRLKNGYCQVKMYNYHRASVVGTVGVSEDIVSKFAHALRRFSVEPHEKTLQVLSYLKNRSAFKSTPHAAIEFLASYEKHDLDRIFQDIDIVVVPSVMRESFNLVTREAIARNTPVICTDSGGPEEVIDNGVNGYVFPTNDDEKLAKIIQDLVNNPSKLEDLRGNIDRQQLVDVKGQATQLEDIYRELTR